jgi:Secretion system C-terminal sorting domain
LEISYGSASVFNDLVSLSCYGANSEITIGNDTDSVQFSGDASLATGSEGLNDGMILLKKISQSSRIDNELTGAEGLVINIESCTFNAGMILTAPSILLKNSVFWGDVALTKTQAASNNYSYGGNSFYGTVTLLNQDGTNAFRFANNIGDHFYNDVTFATGSRRIQMAYAGNSKFEGNVSINSNDVKFNSGSGKVVLSGEKNQTLEGTSQFLICKLELDKSGGTVQLNQQLTIDSSITFVNGVINTDSTITLKAAVTCSGASNQSFVDGPVKKIGNTAFVFPVGDEGQWNPIEITAPVNATDAFTAQNFLNPQTYGNNKDTTIYRLNTCSYWNLTRNSGSSKVYIKLNWDSLRCTLYDTAGLGVASWNGTKWEDLGSGSTTGNVLAGAILSDTVANSYAAFTWSYRTIANNSIRINTSPVLKLNLGSNWNHAISPDYFGYNGANILDNGQYWSDLSDEQVLRYNGISTIRLNGGTFGNYWDWRTGWFIPEDQLPYNWFYTRNSHKQSLPATLGNGSFVNEMRNFKLSNDWVGSRPIFQLNMMTSSFNYEVASLYRAGELNLPVRYIELGNEFYLGDEHFKERFPSSLDYMNYANDFTDRLKAITPFANVQVAVVGASTPNGIPGRRSLWLDVVLDNINNVPARRPDAITIHEYYASGLKEPINSTLTNSNIGKMLQKPFARRDDLFADELNDIAQTNSSLNLTPPLEVWITEYNLDETQGNNIGTWAHGLFNAIQTLTYLESPLITHISSHAMTSNAVFGNIFEDDHGFRSITAGQLPNNINNPNSFLTKENGFTASGSALNEIALALKGNAVIAHRINFEDLPGDPIERISYFEENTLVPTNYLELYGWSFEKENGTEAIILNLGPNQYEFTALDEVGWYGGFYRNFTSMVQITSNEQTKGNGGVNCPNLECDDPLISTNEVEINPISTTYPMVFPPYSLTRLIYRNPTVLSIRLTDEEICQGSETSLLVSGAQPGAQITLFQGTTQIGQPQTDSVFIFGSTLPQGTHQLTAHVGTLVSPPVTLQVNAPLSVVASITSGAVVPCSTQTITLSATANPTPVTTEIFTYLWVPDKHLTGINPTPFSQNIEIDNSELSSESYQVFVFDGQCWAGSNLISFDRGPISVDLGNDFTVCTANTNNFSIHAETVLPPMASIGTLHYSLSIDGTVAVADQLTYDFNSFGILAVGTHVFRVSVWSDNGTVNTANCPIIDEVIVTVANCCNCSQTAIELNPEREEYTTNINGTLYTSVHNVSTTEDLIDELNLPNPNFTKLLDDDTRTLTISPSGIISLPVICINGEFWINPTNIDNVEYRNIVIEKCKIRLGPNASIKVRGRTKLTLKGCVIESCNGTELWDGIYVDISDQGILEPEIELTKSATGERNKIKQAKNAIVVRRDSPYSIEYCDFEDNYIDIKFETCKKIIKQERSGNGNNATFINNFIRSNTFTSSGGTLLSPYNNVHKFAAIVLDDVERVVIGDSSLDASVTANEISSSRYGIVSIKSSLETFNNRINELLTFFEDWPAELPPATTFLKANSVGIYFHSLFDNNDRKLLIGERFDNSGVTDTRNVFTNMGYNVWTENETNAEVHFSDFGNGDEDAVSGTNCILINNPGSKTIEISEGNNFTNFLNGIRINEPCQNSEISISSNNIFSGLPLNGGGFAGTGIMISHVSGITPKRMFISENVIGGTLESAFGFPRIGIRMANISGLEIEENQIQFSLSNTPGFHYSGVWIENCRGAKIRNNRILNIDPPNQLYLMDDLLVGLRVDHSHAACIEENNLEALGQGMRFTGNSIVYSLFKNVMSDFDQGIWLNNADIGSSQGSGASTFQNDLDNMWFRSNGPSADRIQGLTMNGVPINWFTRSTSPTDARYPDGDLFVVNPIQIVSNAPSHSQCPVEDSDDPPYSNNERNAWFGAVTGDSARYDENYYHQFKYVSESVLFSELKRYPTLLDMNDSSDASFQDFFEARLNSNYALVDSIVDLVKSDLLNDALQITEEIYDTNDIEFCVKSVFLLYLNSRISGIDFTSQDTTLLDSIAELNAIINGPGVLMARIILNKEKYDYFSSGSRIISPTKRETPRVLDIRLYPNPAQDILFISPSQISDDYSITVTDLTGRELLRKTNHLEIATSTLNTSSYLLIYEAEEQWVVKKFEIIN